MEQIKKKLKKCYHFSQELGITLATCNQIIMCIAFNHRLYNINLSIIMSTRLTKILFRHYLLYNILTIYFESQLRKNKNQRVGLSDARLVRPLI